MPRITSDEDEDYRRKQEEEDIEEAPEGDEEAAGSDGEDDDEYVVEKIKAHMWRNHKLHLRVKWKGYEKVSDETWEPESNCEGAQEALQEYYSSIGGRPTEGGGTKRGRTSTGAAATPAGKKSRTTPRNETPVEEESKWKPPGGSWENEIKAIDTIEKTHRGLICYIHWANGKKSQHEVHTVYKKAPQRMLQFYEQHLVFKDATQSNHNLYKDGDE